MLNEDAGRRAVALACLFLACACGVGLGARSVPAGEMEGGGWRTYRNRAYGFSIKYPGSYVILGEPKEASEGARPALARVRFQEKSIASGQFADHEPPRFSVEVFGNSGGESLRGWLAATRWLDERDGVGPLELDGALEGLRVQKAVQMAPNKFYFYRTERYVFILTPLGEHGQEMLSSFKLLP